jgi:Flp pilus assembly protein TadB
MSETIKLNLSKIILVLGLISIGGGAYAALDARMDNIERKQERFEGIMDERTRNTQEDVKRIYDIVKEWEKD